MLNIWLEIYKFTDRCKKLGSFRFEEKKKKEPNSRKSECERERLNSSPRHNLTVISSSPRICQEFRHDVKRVDEKNSWQIFFFIRLQ